MKKDEIQKQKSAILGDAKSLKAQLVARTSTHKFLSLVNEIYEQYGFQLVNTPSSGFYKEAYLAARFAPWRGASHVWLDDDDPPDFWIEVEGERLSFEAREVLRPGRRRDLELQHIMETGLAQPYPPQNRLSVDENVKLLNEAVRAKSAAKYLHIYGLVLYLDTGPIIHDGPILDGIEAVVNAFREKIIDTHYREVWVACSNICERIR